jgi:hypothetical protein
MSISGAGFKRSMRLRAAYNYFSVKDAVANEFFEELLELLIYA